MNTLQRSNLSGRSETSKYSEPLTVDASSPCMRDFVLRHVLEGTIRVIPAGRGKLAIIPTGAWLPDELLPNAAGTLLVELALRAAYAPVLVASLGFLSFGLDPPTPEWGLIIAENRALIFISPATVIGPGFLLASLVVGINLATEGLARLIGRTVTRTT